MLKKRLIGVITVKDGWAVQSIGYRRYLPLGHPQWLAQNLDRWSVDEILVLSIDRTRAGLGPDLALLQRLGSLGLSTPLAYGGGISAPEHARAVVQSGADRVCVDAVLRANPAAVRKISQLVGAQAVIGVLPLAVRDDALQWRDHLSDRDTRLDHTHLQLFEQRVVSEALIVDWTNEGRRAGFDMRLVQHFPLQDVSMIAFGGLSEPEQIAQLLEHERVSAAAVGNFLSYREHAVQKLRQQIGERHIRRANFASGS